MGLRVLAPTTRRHASALAFTSASPAGGDSLRPTASRPGATARANCNPSERIARSISHSPCRAGTCSSSLRHRSACTTFSWHPRSDASFAAHRTAARAASVPSNPTTMGRGSGALACSGTASRETTVTPSNGVRGEGPTAGEKVPNAPEIIALRAAGEGLALGCTRTEELCRARNVFTMTAALIPFCHENSPHGRHLRSSGDSRRH